MSKKPKEVVDGKKSPKILLERIARRVYRSSVPEVLLVSTLIMARWWQNSDFSYPSELILPLILFAVLVSLIYYLYRWLLGGGLAPHIAALGLSYCLYAFHLVEGTRYAKAVAELVPGSLETEFTKSLAISLVLLILFGLLGWGVGWLLERFKTLRQLQLQKVLLFAVVFIFSWQVIKVAGRLIEINDEHSYNYPASKLEKNTTSAIERPDIYYLVFDRYGNQETLKNIYDYDNSQLLNFLSSQGFVTNGDAYANYPFTMSSVSSTMAMNYFPEFEKMFGGKSDWQTGFPYRSILKNPPIAQELKKNGYSYNQISSWWDFTRVGIKADTNPIQSFRLSILTKEFYLSDLQRDILNKSILSHWFKKGVTAKKDRLLKYDLTRNPRQNFESQIAELKKLAGREDKSKPQFSFAHVLVPHDPYIFDKDGSDPSYDEARTDNGVDETVKYTNQLTYLNKRIEDLVAHIRSNAPGAAIIIQADEGPYPKQFRHELSADHYYDPATLPVAQMKQKFGIIASYYFPGLSAEDTTPDTSVNVFRFVLNKYLGYQLSMLPACNFSTGDKFTVYEYEQVSEKLTGEPADPACENL